MSNDRLTILPSILSWAEAAGLAFHAEQERCEYSGDLVQTTAPPDIAAPLTAAAALHFNLSLRVDGIVMTCGVDSHTDIEGDVLMICLFNPGLTFHHGRTHLKPAPGDTFWFDDRKPHRMSSCKADGSFVGLALRPTSKH